MYNSVLPNITISENDKEKDMKRLISFATALFICLSLAACAKDTADEVNNENEVGENEIVN